MENEKIIIPPASGSGKNKSIETYAEDMAKVIDGSEGGLIKKIIHEQELHESEKKNLSPTSNKNKAFMFIGFLLLFLAIVLVIFLGFLKQKMNITEPVTEAKTFIFTDQNYFQDISGLNKDTIAQSVLNEVRNSDVEKGGVEAIYLTLNKQVVGFREFIKIIQGSFIAPAPVFLDDNFLIGIVNTNTQASSSNKDLFLLLKVRSFTDVFENMRSWEPKMFNDLHGFFNITISSDTKELLTKDFTDGRISNKNARILYDKMGNIVLMYIFADDHSVIITNSEGATAEVILRLAGSQISK